MDLLIDPEFKNWIMPLRDDELAGLEENILQYGCTNPLDVWNNIIVDGHNRYKICQKHGIPFEVHVMAFSSREDAKNYMIKNQLSRRNVTPEQRDYLMGRMYHEQKNTHGGNRKSSPQNEDMKKSEQICEQFNVGHATVERAEKFAIAVDAIASNCGHDLRDKILSGSVDVTKKDVIRLASMPHNEQQAAISKIRSGMKGKHAIDRIEGEPEDITEDIEIPDSIMIPCGNPRCDREIRIAKKQYKELVGVYPEKYGHVTVPYCSNVCRDAVFRRIANVK